MGSIQRKIKHAVRSDIRQSEFFGVQCVVCGMGGAAHALFVFRSDDRYDYTAFKKTQPENER